MLRRVGRPLTRALAHRGRFGPTAMARYHVRPMSLGTGLARGYGHSYGRGSLSVAPTLLQRVSQISRAFSALAKKGNKEHVYIAISDISELAENQNRIINWRVYYELLPKLEEYFLGQSSTEIKDIKEFTKEGFVNKLLEFLKKLGITDKVQVDDIFEYLNYRSLGNRSYKPKTLRNPKFRRVRIKNSKGQYTQIVDVGRFLHLLIEKLLEEQQNSWAKVLDEDCLARAKAWLKKEKPFQSQLTEQGKRLTYSGKPAAISVQIGNNIKSPSLPKAYTFTADEFIEGYRLPKDEKGNNLSADHIFEGFKVVNLIKCFQNREGFTDRLANAIREITNNVCLNARPTRQNINTAKTNMEQGNKYLGQQITSANEIFPDEHVKLINARKNLFGEHFTDFIQLEEPNLSESEKALLPEIQSFTNKLLTSKAKKVDCPPSTQKGGIRFLYKNYLSEPELSEKIQYFIDAITDTYITDLAFSYSYIFYLGDQLLDNPLDEKMRLRDARITKLLLSLQDSIQDVQTNSNTLMGAFQNINTSLFTNSKNSNVPSQDTSIERQLEKLMCSCSDISQTEQDILSENIKHALFLQILNIINNFDTQMKTYSLIKDEPEDTDTLDDSLFSIHVEVVRPDVPPNTKSTVPTTIELKGGTFMKTNKHRHTRKK